MNSFCQNLVTKCFEPLLVNNINELLIELLNCFSVNYCCRSALLNIVFIVELFSYSTIKTIFNNKNNIQQ